MVIKMQLVPLVLIGKNTDKALVCLYVEISVSCVIYLTWDLFKIFIFFCYSTYFNITKCSILFEK